jgi:gas vesicle protein
MAGFRRSTWFALGLMVGGLMGGALGLMLAPQPAEEMRRWLRTGVGPEAERLGGVISRLSRSEQPASEIAEEALEAEVSPEETASDVN